MRGTMIIRLLVMCAGLLAILVTPAEAQPNGPASPRPARPATAPARVQPPAPAPGPAPLCMYDGKQYTLGAAICISSQIWQYCNPPDATHAFVYWQPLPQPLCAGTLTNPPPA